MKRYFNVIIFFSIMVVASSAQYCFAQQFSLHGKNEPISSLSLKKLQKKAIELRYYDEVLTSSVLNYAYSGDEQWINKYNEYEKKLTLLINALLEKKVNADGELLTHLNNINKLLVSLEVNAITAVKNNKEKVAVNIINSTEYRHNKAKYLSVLMSYITQIENRDQLAKLSKQADTGINSTDKSFINFTQKEEKWIAENKVIIGIEHWPPIVFMQDKNNPAGLSGEILKQIIDKSNLQVEYVTGSWEGLLSQFKEGEIDLLPDAYFFEERKAFGYFSTPYFMVKEVFYVKDRNTRFQSNIDLTNATIAISSGYTTIDKIKALYPNIKILETTGIEDSIERVLSGKADALLDAQIVVDDLINQKHIEDLRVIDEDVVFPSSLHLFTHKNKETLHDILQKGLDSIKASDLMNSNNDWLTSRNKTQRDKPKDSYEFGSLIWFILGVVALLAILGVGISSLVLKVSEEKLVVKFSSSSFKTMIFTSLIGLSVLLIVLASYVLSYAENRQFESLDYSLQNLLTSTHQRMTTWIKYKRNSLSRWVKI
ncbi:MAG: transporter substrate-binding domain-containing protein [Colwellia sp.]